MRVSVLSRGGLAVFGGLYDPHQNEAVIQVRDGETAAVTIEFPSTPTNLAVVEDGLTATTPTLVTNTNKATMTLSGMQDGGRADVTATVNGETKLVRIRSKSRAQIDGYDCWPEPYL